MVPVYGATDKYGTEAFFQSRIFPIELGVEEIKSDAIGAEWQGCYPGFTEYGSRDGTEIVYSRYNSDNSSEPFVIPREYNGLGVEDEVEIVEEFRLLNNLYYDQSKREYRDLVRDVAVVKIDEHNFVTVHKQYLIRYLAVKNMTICIQVDSLCKQQYDNTIKPEPLKYFKCENGIMSIAINSSEYFPKETYSLVYAKKMIQGCKIEDCGYWPYEGKDYEEFIVGLDRMGKERFFTCDPLKLQNLFGSNQKAAEMEAPLYLTPIFFRREVLQRYYDHPDKYNVEDGCLRCGNLWLLRMDNLTEGDYISAYLGDLGTDIPNDEQKHWKNYNIAIDGTISDAKWRRDFAGIATNPNTPDLAFKMKYQCLCEKYEKGLGWPIFIPLGNNDKHNFSGIRVLLNNTQSEFDELVLLLVKVLIDSINEKEISKCISSIPSDAKGISKLEIWLDEKGIIGFENHVQFLRNLQELRSTGTGHLKGKKYLKASENFDLRDNNYRETFNGILRRACDFLDFLDKALPSLLATQIPESK